MKKNKNEKNETERGYDKIEPSVLRQLIAQAQIDGTISEELGLYIMRIHDIVKKQRLFLRGCTKDELEDATSWSLERWMRKGIWKIDLSKFQNPFSYLYRGSCLNMTNRIQQLRKKEQQRVHFENEVRLKALQAMPGLQNKDMTHINDL